MGNGRLGDGAPGPWSTGAESRSVIRLEGESLTWPAVAWSWQTAEWAMRCPGPHRSAGVPLGGRIEHMFFGVNTGPGSWDLDGAGGVRRWRGEVDGDGWRSGLCAVEGCEKRAKRGSMHCDLHAKSAVGQAARRELRDLLRELEKLAEVTDPASRRRADMRFMRKLESGRYPVLFSAELKELEAERRRNAELGVELGGLRLSLYRAF